MVLNFLSLQTIDKSELQTTNMRKQLALLLTLIFLLNLLVVDNQDAELQNSKSTNDTLGLTSNYSLELKTNALEENRAKHLSFIKTDYGIKSISYDDFTNTWYYRENNNGTWFESILSNEPQDNENWMSLRFILTDFGIFKIYFQGGSNDQGCQNYWYNYELIVENYSNSSNHANIDFCSPGSNYFSSINTAAFDFGFSLALTTCWNAQSGGADYRDNLITIYQNGSYENRQHNSRSGVDWTCGNSGWEGDRVSIITTNNVSCYHLNGNNDYSNTEKLHTKCFNHQDDTSFDGDFCYQYTTNPCPIDPYVIRYDNSIYFYEEDNIATGQSVKNFYLLNHSGFHQLNNIWYPTNCQQINWNQLNDGDEKMFVVHDYFFCYDENGDNPFFWTPINNQSISVPSQLVVSNGMLLSATWINNNALNLPQKNWFLTNAIVIINSKTAINFGVLWSDYDRDSVIDNLDKFPMDNSQSFDSDEDGYGDNALGILPDSCPFEFGNSTNDRYGCSDFDGDGWSDTRDFFPNDKTQWNDTDLDGYGDSITGTRSDSCPNTYGTSTYNNTLGCPDQDFDGWADIDDKFQFDSSQWQDDDNDGYGNELNGFEGDSCPSIYGNSSNDRFGCLDSDGDGWSDDGDALPNNPTQWLDRDGDGFGDNQLGTEPDVFPTDGTQWIDFDGDGYGDNILGNQGDAFPDDPLEWKDSDGDYLGDNADMFPFDPTQTEDRDGDGMGDNPMGIGADKFPDDPTQWGDIDGDGYGDNPLGNNPDVFITDATQWFDRDGDGRGDNDQGRNYDRFPDNPTQWIDLDEDGLGDNQSGTNADPFLNDFDNDGYNDSVDILPKLESPGDLDADGCLDEVDAFPSNSQECVDTDGDGVGDNADSDDDGDGWTDADEERLGTDSLSASDQPIDSFEIVIPGTAVGLGAWDLIGIFGGIPLFAWLAFGFATRNGRCARYEELLKEATSRDELEQVALRWEYSLMLRMLGPHQGIRLERLRAELDDKFENATYDETDIGFDQTSIVENEGKDIPPINESFTGPTKETAATSTDDSGYEWFKQGEYNWYRPVGSNDEWFKFEN